MLNWPRLRQPLCRRAEVLLGREQQLAAAVARVAAGASSPTGRPALCSKPPVASPVTDSGRPPPAYGIGSSGVARRVTSSNGSKCRPSVQ